MSAFTYVVGLVVMVNLLQGTRSNLANRANANSNQKAADMLPWDVCIMNWKLFILKTTRKPQVSAKPNFNLGCVGMHAAIT